MAFRVPTARPTVGDIGTTRSTQNVRPPAAAFGDFSAAIALGQAGQRLGQELLSTAAVIREQKDSALVNDRLAAARNDMNRTLYDPDEGLMNQTGEKSFGLGDTFATRSREISSRYKENLTPRQQGLFDKQFRTAQAAGVRAVSIHEAGARRDHLNKSADALIATSIRDILSNPLDEKIRDAELGEIRAKIDEVAALNGWSDEQKKNKTDIIMGTYYTGMAARLANINPQLALEFYKENEASIPGDVKKQIKDMIDDADLLGFGQRFTDEVFAKHPNNAKARLKAARAIKDPQRREEALQAIDRREVRDRDAAKQRDDAIFKAAMGAAKQGKAPSPEIWAELTKEQRKQARAIMDLAINGVEPVTNSKVRTVALALSEEQLKKMTIDDIEGAFRPNLNNDHYDALVKRWQAANKQFTGPVVREQMFDEVFNKSMREAGLIPVNEKRPDWSDEQAQAFDRIESEVRKRIAQESKLIKGELDRAATQRIIDDVLGQKVIIEGFPTDSEVVVAAADPEQLAEGKVKVQTGFVERVSGKGPGRRTTLVPKFETVSLSDAGDDSTNVADMASAGGQPNTVQRRALAILVKKRLNALEPNLSMEAWMSDVRAAFDKAGRPPPTLADFQTIIERMEKSVQ